MGQHACPNPLKRIDRRGHPRILLGSYVRTAEDERRRTGLETRAANSLEDSPASSKSMPAAQSRATGSKPHRTQRNGPYAVESSRIVCVEQFMVVAVIRLARKGLLPPVSDRVLKMRYTHHLPIRPGGGPAKRARLTIPSYCSATQISEVPESAGMQTYCEHVESRTEPLLAGPTRHDSQIRGSGRKHICFRGCSRG